MKLNVEYPEAESDIQIVTQELNNKLDILKSIPSDIIYKCKGYERVICELMGWKYYTDRPSQRYYDASFAHGDREIYIELKKSKRQNYLNPVRYVEQYLKENTNASRHVTTIDLTYTKEAKLTHITLHSLENMFKFTFQNCETNKHIRDIKLSRTRAPHRNGDPKWPITKKDYEEYADYTLVL